ncbi:MAG: hydroxymethylbilane synthase [Gammaproteobacteria bacterium]|nr:hydroxymethylbilane synthase [Gammaproteobacteria bacterium]
MNNNTLLPPAIPTINCVKIATRRSPLALWQANDIKNSLNKLHPDLTVELILMTTEGDINLASSLANQGGKGLFIKELERALLIKKADIAVHSMKDMTVYLPENLTLGAFSPREEVRDAFISHHYNSLDDLPERAIIGTASLRRKAQLLIMRPDLDIRLLRGNVNTRLDKLAQGEYDAIILAAAGLIRLGLQKEIKQLFSIEQMLPAIGQAIIGIECRADDTEILPLIRQLNCPNSQACVTAERSMNELLGGHCSAPIAGLARLVGDQLHLQGRVLSPDGSIMLEAFATKTATQAQALGFDVAEQLIAQGAKKILNESREALLK